MKLVFAIVAALVWTSLAPAADPPPGESLIALSIEREGGAKAVRAASTAVMTGTVEMVGHNLKGPLEIYQDGERAYTVVELPGLGKIEEGYDGAVAWESNLIQGARIKEGEELAATRRAVRSSRLDAWKNFYKSARTIGPAEVDGKPAWQVEMITTEDHPEQFFFDQESGLLVRISHVLTTSMGDIPVETTMSDFRPVSGVQTPFLITQKALSQNVAMHIEKVTYGVNIPKERFSLPETVQALLKTQLAK